MSTVSANPRFTRKEEIALHARMVAGDLEAKELLAKSVLNWALKLAHSIAGRRIDRDELHCLAGFGIAKAMAEWNPTISGLITFVTFSVRNEVMKHSLSFCGPVYVPEKAENSQFSEQAKAGRAKATSLSLSASKVDRPDLEAVLLSTSDDDAEPWQRMSRAEDRQQLKDRLESAFGQLGNDRTKQIVLGIQEGRSTVELGIELGISQQLVSRINKQALLRLREILEEPCVSGVV